MASVRTARIVNKVANAVAFTIVSAVLLAILGMVIWAMVSWYNIEPVSFIVVVGFGGTIALFATCMSLIEWSQKKIEAAAAEEEEMQKLDAYRTKHGEDAVPPMFSGVYKFDSPPMSRRV